MKTLGLNGLGPGLGFKASASWSVFQLERNSFPVGFAGTFTRGYGARSDLFFFHLVAVTGRDTLTHSARADVDRGGRVFFAALRRHAELWRLRPKAENGPWTRSSPRRRSIITFHPFINNRPVSVMNFSPTAIFQPLLEC